METLHDRLKKIEALANSGAPGERDNARRMLDALCAKYDVTPEQLATDKTSAHDFTVANRDEATILRQVVIMVCGTQRVDNLCKGRKLRFWLTAAQAIDVRDCFEHHRRPFAQHMDEALAAYIYKNKLYGPAEDKSEKEISAKALAAAKRIAAMMAMMESNRWQKRVLLTA